MTVVKFIFDVPLGRVTRRKGKYHTSYILQFSTAFDIV
jgi:hypothetical protein